MVEGEEVIGICWVECCGQGVSFGRKSNLLKVLQAEARIASEHQWRQWRYLGARSKREQYVRGHGLECCCDIYSHRIPI